tara:strand:+ start:837 stop:1136 length:300 start_codon:yes stop_codon:yes gene_type:complete
MEGGRRSNHQKKISVSENREVTESNICLQKSGTKETFTPTPTPGARESATPTVTRMPTAIRQRLRHGTGATTMISWFSQTIITVPYWNTAPASGDFKNL